MKQNKTRIFSLKELAIQEENKTKQNTELTPNLTSNYNWSKIKSHNKTKKQVMP